MRSSNTSSGSGTNECQGRFSHLRNMRALCKPFFELGTCDLVDCPYSHKVGDFRIPGEQCRFEVCKMTMCEFFHGTVEQWKALKHHRDTAIPTPTTYRPSDYLELRDPHVEVSRTPAPSGVELVAGVRQHLMGKLPPAHQHHQTIPSAMAGGGGGGGFSMVPSSPSVALPPPSATSQLGTAPIIPQHMAMTQAPVPIQAPQVTMLRATNGSIVAWFCGQCNAQNSMDRVQCTHCEVAPPWNCAMCHTANFGSRQNCVACRANHPQHGQQFVNNQHQQVPLVMQLPIQQQQQQQQPPHQCPTGMLPVPVGTPHFSGKQLLTTIL